MHAAFIGAAMGLDVGHALEEPGVDVGLSIQIKYAGDRTHGYPFIGGNWVSLS